VEKAIQELGINPEKWNPVSPIKKGRGLVKKGRCGRPVAFRAHPECSQVEAAGGEWGDELEVAARRGSYTG